MNEKLASPTSKTSADLPADLRYHAKHVTQGGPTMERAAVEIERLTRGMNGQADVIVQAQRELAAALIRVDELERANVGLATESERRRAALAGLKDLTCGECVPCLRINAEIDKALSGDPGSAVETNGNEAALRRVIDRHVKWRETAIGFLRQVIDGRGTEDEWPAKPGIPVRVKEASGQGGTTLRKKG